MRQLTQLACDLHRQRAGPRRTAAPATVEPGDGRTFLTRFKQLGEP